MRHRRSGFSLVELLAVVAVIAILLQLLMPLTSFAKERGRQAVCLKNVNQLGVGIASYASDHDGWITPWSEFQPSWHSSWSTLGWFKWPVTPRHSNMLSYYSIENGFSTQLAHLFRDGYVTPPETFYCPSDPHRQPVYDKDDPHWSPGGFFEHTPDDIYKIKGSYSFNPMQYWRMSSQVTERLRGPNNIRRIDSKYNPSQAVVAMDMITSRGGDGSYERYHQDVWNLSHLDGSGRSYRNHELADRIDLGQDVESNWDVFLEQVDLLLGLTD